jgi:hypothetical protein
VDFRKHWQAILNDTKSSPFKQRMAREALQNLGYREPNVDAEKDLQLMRERMAKFERSPGEDDEVVSAP